MVLRIGRFLLQLYSKCMHGQVPEKFSRDEHGVLVCHTLSHIPALSTLSNSQNSDTQSTHKNEADTVTFRLLTTWRAHSPNSLTPSSP